MTEYIMKNISLESVPQELKIEHKRSEIEMKKTSMPNYEKNINLDVLTKLVSLKILEKENKDKEKRDKLMNILFLIGSIVFVLFMLAQLYYHNKQPSYSRISRGVHGAKKGEDGAVFEFIDGSKYIDIKYFGKENLKRRVICEITKMVSMIRTMPPSELLNNFDYSQKNYLLTGPPGTGKTHFIKQLAANLDLNLKMKFYIELHGEGSISDDNTDVQIKKKLSEIDSLVRVVFVSPALLNSKFVGETEKNIGNLFKKAREDTKYWATILFIDEIDAFFETRDGNNTNSASEHSIKSKTEFLNNICGINDKIDSLVFLFGATNRETKLDPAFVRRFGSTFKFDNPTPVERKHLITEKTKVWSGPKDPFLDDAVNASHNYSHHDIINGILYVNFSCEDSNANKYKMLLEYMTRKNSNNEKDKDENREASEGLMRHCYIKELL